MTHGGVLITPWWGWELGAPVPHVVITHSRGLAEMKVLAPSLAISGRDRVGCLIVAYKDRGLGSSPGLGSLAGMIGLEPELCFSPVVFGVKTLFSKSFLPY